MAMTEWLFDGVLGLLLLVLAIGSIYAPRLYTGIVLFIAFGLALALAWARLGAPDLALAEAAIGAGLTGTLLLSAYAQVSQEPTAMAGGLQRHGMTLLSVLILAMLVAAVWPMPGQDAILPGLAATNVPDAGVAHPVTAVLLNFRAWDTLLELLVLLLALMGVRQLRPTGAAGSHGLPRPWPLLMAWSRVLAPLCVFFGAYLLWRGSAYPGGAFQAGALLAAGGVILRLNGLLPALSWNRLWVRGVIVLGLCIFLGTGLWGLLATGTWLAYPLGLAGPLILVIEIAATLSIALTLVLLVVGDPEEVQS